MSLYLVIEWFHVQYDNRTSNEFVVWKDDGSCRRFEPGPRGLYYCDMSNVEGTVLTNYGYDAVDTITPETINTVKENLKLFNHRQVASEKLARQLQDTAGQIPHVYGGCWTVMG